MQPSAASTAIGPICVAGSTGQVFGNYCLLIQVDSVPDPLRVVFNFTNASQWTREHAEAKLRADEAKRQLDACLREVNTQESRVTALSAQITSKLAAAGTASQQGVSLGNWQAISQTFLARLQQLPVPRPAKSSQLVTQAEKHHLLQIPGVLGFVYDHLGVADETDARLLSWYAQLKLSWLVVSTWSAKLAVEDLWIRQWKKRQQLTLLPLDRVSQAPPNLLQLNLPHAGISSTIAAFA